MDAIKMVDLEQEHRSIAEEMRAAMDAVISSGQFINGPAVSRFESACNEYLSCDHTIACANGTDALQLALMGLSLAPGDEIIVPAFGYISIVEVALLLGLRPVFVDVDVHTCNIDASKIEQAISDRTKVIVPIHLYGQAADMESIWKMAEAHQLYVIEDNAQSFGTTLSNGAKSGSQSTLSCSSFFPTKNLGSLGDAGAVHTNDAALATRIRKMTKHGQVRKYHHDIIGLNSRLDTLQAAILEVKLRYLNTRLEQRQNVAKHYKTQLENISGIILPQATTSPNPFSNHTFNQYTLRVLDGQRDALKAHLESQSIPSTIYYPLPMADQQVVIDKIGKQNDFPIAQQLCHQVLSLPMHPMLTEDEIAYIGAQIKSFFHS